jgi:hypothetical protein
MTKRHCNGYRLGLEFRKRHEKASLVHCICLPFDIKVHSEQTRESSKATRKSSQGTRKEGLILMCRCKDRSEEDLKSMMRNGTVDRKRI